MVKQHFDPPSLRGWPFPPQAIIVDVLIRKNRANEGASVGEAADILEQIFPEYSRKLSSSTKPSGAPCGRNTVSA